MFKIGYNLLQVYAWTTSIARFIRMSIENIGSNNCYHLVPLEGYNVE